LDFICAYLGKNENRQSFFDEQANRSLPSMEGWIPQNLNELKEKFSNVHQTLDERLADQNNLALLKQLLDALLIEKHYFDEYYIETNPNISAAKDFRLKRADHYLSLLFEYQRLKAENRSIGLLHKFYHFFIYGMREFGFYQEPSEKIISYLQKRYYEEKIKELQSESDELTRKLERYSFDKEMNIKRPLMVYKTAKGNHARGRYNQRQIDVAFEEVMPEQSLLNNGKTIAIISPYRQQADGLIKVIEERGYVPQIDANTVHKFQGMEKDIIIFTTVANEINDFIDNPNLINVAVSRAVEQMIVVAADYHEEGNLTNVGDLIKYIEYNNFEVVDSKIYSVFDLLYKQYSEELLKHISKRRKVSVFDSENLMESVIQKVLNEEKFRGLDRILHQPLRMLIRDVSLLTEEEYRFVRKPQTHTDFLIFNRIDKSPVLVVEVDGYALHAARPEQLERDKVKDEILRKYGIQIIRFRTNGSQEEQKLRERLLAIIE